LYEAEGEEEEIKEKEDGRTETFMIVIIPINLQKHKVEWGRSGGDLFWSEQELLNAQSTEGSFPYVFFFSLSPSPFPRPRFK
jgi:hypothetical protein